MKQKTEQEIIWEVWTTACKLLDNKKDPRNIPIPQTLKDVKEINS